MKKRAESVAQVVEHLLGKHQAISSTLVPQTTPPTHTDFLILSVEGRKEAT
jgi:hypothetical protein